MRTIATVCLVLALAGCAPDWETDGTLTGFVKEVANPGSTYKARQAAEKARQAANDAKCRELGFKPDTDAYGNCRLQLEQIRATKQAAAASERAAAAAWEQPTQSDDLGLSGLSLLCKSAISRGDSGGTFVFC